MNKLYKIISLLELMSDSDIKQLEQIQIVDEKRTPNEYIFSLLLSKPFSPHIYKILKNIDYEGINIKTKIISVKNIDSLDVQEYLMSVAHNHNDLKLFRKCIEQSRFTFDLATRYITFKYAVEIEKDEINSVLKEIIDLLKNAFGLSELNFEFIEDDIFKSKLAAKKQKQKQELEEVIKQSENKESLKQASSDTSINKIDDKKIINLDGLMDGMSNINVSGEIFDIEIKETPKFKSYKLSITDYHSTLIIKYIVFSEANNYNRKNIESILSNVKKGDWILSTIDVKSDSYEQEIYGIIKKINIVDKPKKFIRTDDSNQKRIELTCHSKMSSFDGVCELNEIVSLAKQFHMPAIALTDRYNLQSFPEFEKICKKNNIQPIYGVEMNILPHTKKVLNDSLTDLNKMNYIIFDLETTGLYPNVDDIIEFGAIKYENGVKVDSIQFFIKPNKHLSDTIIELTGINNHDLENAISQELGIKKIIEYIGDSVLIAHNGINFDFRFLASKAEKYLGINLTNTVIDTLHIARSIYPNWKSHTLQKMCKEFKIEYGEDEAHRADYDAMVLNSCWSRLMQDFNNLEIRSIKDLNVKLDSVRLKSFYQSYFCYVYPKNNEGLKKLNELISISHTSSFYSEPKLTYDMLEMNRNDLLIAPSPLDGEIWYYALTGTHSELKKAISKYDYIFIAPPNNYLPWIKSNEISIEQIRHFIRKIISISLEQNKKVIAVSDAYYVNEWDKKYQEVYLYAKALNGRRHRYYKYKCLPDQFIRNTKEMINEFSFLNDEDLVRNIVIDNSHIFYESISKDIEIIKRGLFAPKMDNVDELLKNKVYETAKEIYGENLPEQVLSRLDKELSSIISNNFSVVYWISHLLVKKSYEDGYTVGSRGSVGSSLVATMLKITDVNPLPPHYICNKCKYSEFVSLQDDGFDLNPSKCPNCDGTLYGQGHDIPFETFLGFKGDKTPDIDLNFSGQYQPQAHDFIREIFGKERAFRAGTISKIAEKTCFSIVREYFNEINQIDVKNSLVQLYTKKCENVKRTTGQHPGGILVIPKEYSVYDFTPFNFPADDTTSDWYTTHYAFEYLHDNLLKFDILGHDNPTILKMLKDITGVDEASIPNNDPNVLKLFSSPEPLKLVYPDFVNFKNGAITIPEFGTKFVREMLDDTKPQSFADLIRISGLSHGTNVYLGNAKDLIKKQNLKLKDVIGCRDDIMIYLIHKGIDDSTAFKIMEDVRKGKKLKEEYMDLMRAKNVPEWYIDSCNKIEYMFPKAHATAYVMHAWKFAWYKIYHPLPYYSVFLTTKAESLEIDVISKGKESIKARIDQINSLLSNKETAKNVKQKEINSIAILEVCLEMACRGINIKKPDIFLSDSTNYIIHNNEIIAPFNCIDGLGDEIAKTVVLARQEKPFSSLQDVVDRTKLNKTSIARLEELGVFDGLPKSNQSSLM